MRSVYKFSSLTISYKQQNELDSQLNIIEHTLSPVVMCSGCVRVCGGSVSLSGIDFFFCVKRATEKEQNH